MHAVSITFLYIFFTSFIEHRKYFIACFSVAIRFNRSLDNGFNKVIVSILGTPDGIDITDINNITRLRFNIYLW